jgi:glycosyltransferase involved in cell wall biosynthesis
MNILFINNIPFNPRYGGIERVTDILTKGLLALNNDYHIFYLTFKIENREMLKYDFPAPLYELPCDGWLENEKNLDCYCRIINENKIDVIVNQRGTYLIIDSGTVSLKKHPKIISVIHSVVDGRRRESYFSCKKTFLGRCKYIIKKFFPFILEIYLQRKIVPQIKNYYCSLAESSDAIILLSSQYVEDIKAYIGDGFKETLITSIPNPNTFPLSVVHYENKKKQLLYVGRLESRQKAPLRLLKIWEKIYKKHQDWELVMVGDGDAKEPMERYVKRHRLVRVNFVGNKQNVIDYYRKASILCMTSNYEGWPMVLPEGMVNGCVPICFNSFGAATDLIDDGINGFLIPPFNLDDYARKLSELMADKNKIIVMGKKSQEKVKSYTVNNIIPQWDELFQRVIWGKD